MKSMLIKKLVLLICLCLISVLTFTACKEKTVYTKKDIEKEESGSDSDYWKEPSEDIYVPNTSDDGTGETPDFSADDNNSTTSSNKVNTNSDDIDNDGIKNDVDTDVDGDGIKNENDSDIDGDGIKNENDTDIDGDGTDNDKDDDIDGDVEKNDDDETPNGPKSNEGPLVPTK